MGTITKLHLSSSLHGEPIQISATGSPGNIIHTTTTSSNIIDEVWLYANNINVNDCNLNVHFAGTGSNNLITVGIPAQTGLFIIIPGNTISGKGSTPSYVRAYSSITGSINVSGYINRIET